MNRSQKALQAVLVEGITPAEAAERYGISTAAVSKAKHHPSKKQLHAAELDKLRAQLAEAQEENERLKEMAMFFSTYTDPDELEMDEIENAARKSFRRANSGVRGTTITRANSYESHVIWATKARINKEVTAARTALTAAEAREEKLLKALSTCKGWDEDNGAYHVQAFDSNLVAKAIAQPRDDSALREMIAGVYEECAKGCRKEAVVIVVDGPEERAYNNAISDCELAIRALAEKAKA